jgi:pseudaminic acid cytidylyltransferase
LKVIDKSMAFFVSMKNLCIIPARGGSKRIPRKNIKDFLGKPMLAYAIENALNSKLFNEVMVSTDDDEIVELAIKYGANVPFLRSEQSSNDFASTAAVIVEVLEEYSKIGKEFDYFCCLYPCTPLLDSEHLQSAFYKLENNDFETVMPIIQFSVPIQRAMIVQNEFLKWKQPENALKRTQDLDVSYHDAGQFYFMKTKSFLETKLILNDKTGVIVLDEMSVQDIDNETDWKLAELKYQLKNEKI